MPSYDQENTTPTAENDAPANDTPAPVVDQQDGLGNAAFGNLVVPDGQGSNLTYDRSLLWRAEQGLFGTYGNSTTLNANDGSSTSTSDTATGGLSIQEWEAQFGWAHTDTDIVPDGVDGANSTLTEKDANQITVGQDGVGFDHTSSQVLDASNGTGTSSQTTYGGSVAFGDDEWSVNVHGGNSTTETDQLGNSTTNGTSESYTLTDDGFTYSATTGETIKNNDGTVTDNTRTGTVILQEDQVGFGYGQNGRYGQVTYNPEDNEVSLDGSVKTANGVKVGVGVEFRNDVNTGELHTGDTTRSVINALMGPGQDVGYATQIRSWGVDGSLAAKGIDLSGGLQGGSSVTAFETLPADWDQRSDDDKELWYQEQRDRAELYDGIGDIDLTTMTPGQGFEFRSYNGWHAHAGVTYGMLSAEMGGGQSTANDVGLSFDGDAYHVTMRTEHDVDSSIGMGVFGQNLTVGDHSGENEQFTFTVKADDPDAMAAMDQFMETGLLPGADQMAGQEATDAATAFHAARAEIDQLDVDMAAAQQALEASIGPDGMPDPALVDAFQLMQDRYTDAQATMATQRDTLNTMWGNTYSPSNQPPVSGITVVEAMQEEEDGGSLSVGPVEVSEITSVTGHEETLTADGVLDRYYMNSSATLFGQEYSAYGVNTYTGATDTALTASARQDLSVQDNFEALQHVENNPIPDWILAAGADGDNHNLWESLDGNDEAWEGLRAQTNLNISNDTLAAYAAFANDPNNAYSQDLWAGFADRAGAFWSEDGQWWSAQTQDAIDDYGYDGHWDMARDQMIGSAYENSEIARQLGYADELWTVLPDGALPRDQMAAMFSSVNSPEAFQNLPPAYQQVYIDTIVATSLESSPYDAMAAIALIPDEEVRAQEMRELFVKMQTDGQVIGGGMSDQYSFYNDPVMDFASWTDQFQTQNAQLYGQLQSSMSVQVTNDQIAELQGQTADQLGTAMAESADGRRPDTTQMFNVVMAAYNQGGGAGIEAMMQASGMSADEVVAAMAGNPNRQAWVAQMLLDAGRGGELAANTAALLGGVDDIAQYEHLKGVLEAAGVADASVQAAAPTVDPQLLAQMAGQDPTELGTLMREQEQQHWGLFDNWDPNTGYMAAALTTVAGDPAASQALIQGYLAGANADHWGGDDVGNMLNAFDRFGSTQQIGLALDVLRDAGYGDAVDAWLEDHT